MQSAISISGQSIHRILNKIPIGILFFSIVADTFYLFNHDPIWADACYRSMAIGIITALIAAPFGWRDYLKITPRTRAKQLGGLHGISALVMTGLFVVSWLARSKNMYDVPIAAHILSYLGFAMMSVVGFLGGELVNRYGIGISAAPEVMINRAKPIGPERTAA